jgi:hypothetical protein
VGLVRHKRVDDGKAGDDAFAENGKVANACEVIAAN